MKIQLRILPLHHISLFLIPLCILIGRSDQCAATAPGTIPQPSGSRTTTATTSVSSVTTTVASATTTTVAGATTTTVADQTTTTVATTTTATPACALCTADSITLTQGTDSHVDPTFVLGTAAGCSTITYTCQGMPPNPTDVTQLSFYSMGADSGVISETGPSMATMNCVDGAWQYNGLVVDEVDCQVIV